MSLCSCATPTYKRVRIRQDIGWNCCLSRHVIGPKLRVRETIHGICKPYATAPRSSRGIWLPRAFSLVLVGGVRAAGAPSHNEQQNSYATCTTTTTTAKIPKKTLSIPLLVVVLPRRRRRRRRRRLLFCFLLPLRRRPGRGPATATGPRRRRRLQVRLW